MGVGREEEALNQFGSADGWDDAQTRVLALYADLRRLSHTGEATVAALGRALADVTRRRGALLVLAQLDGAVTVELIAPVVEASLSHRDALLAREVVARLPYRQYARHVPPQIDRLLADADHDTYRRLAELLDHLGLHDELDRLCALAATHPDPDVREVAEDFTPVSGPDHTT